VISRDISASLSEWIRGDEPTGVLHGDVGAYGRGVEARAAVGRFRRRGGRGSDGPASARAPATHGAQDRYEHERQEPGNPWPTKALPTADLGRQRSLPSAGEIPQAVDGRQVHPAEVVGQLQQGVATPSTLVAQSPKSAGVEDRLRCQRRLGPAPAPRRGDITQAAAKSPQGTTGRRPLSR
jgi:hypothetical protein